MELDERQKIYENAVSKWGENEQVWMAIEEMGELLTALNHFRRGRASIAELCEEIADVTIMTGQLAAFFGQKSVDLQVELKLVRLKERIKDTSNVFQEKLNTLNKQGED